MKPSVFATALFLFLSGCMGFKAVDAAMTADVGDGVSVTPQIAWSKVNYGTGSATVWTIDGLGLNEMRFLTGIKPGEPLMTIAGVAKKDSGAFQSTMLPDEVMELTASTLGKLNYRQIRTAALRPAAFGAAMGFRFDVNFLNDDGLQFKGVALFAERQGKLDLFLFIAPAEFYFDHYAPTVEKVFASVQVAARPGNKPSS
jgi:hypothetical protein